MEGLIQGAFARALEADRERFNARFTMARRATPRLDPAVFAEHLRVNVAPIVDAVEKIAAEKTNAVVDALYDISLDLVARDFAGPQSRHPAINEGWNSLLPAIAPLVALSPRPVTAAVTNMIFNLSSTPGARASGWVELMRSMASYCTDAAIFLEAGKVVAWRCGMVPYRASALQVCRNMEDGWVRAALGIPEASDGPTMEQMLTRLEKDPWLHPGQLVKPENPVRELHIVTTVGAFRGFGGQMITPPVVGFADGMFVVSDSENSWSLHADAFGAVLMRHGPALKGKKSKDGGAYSVADGGRVSLGNTVKVFPELEDFTSYASDGATLAVTLAASHSVYLIAPIAA